jgi:hypothetical protein
MGERARVRRAQAEAEERARQSIDDTERVRRELQEAAPRFLAGPPDGCRHCWTWNWTPWHGWTWHHFGSYWIEVRPWPERDNEPTECCMHQCHGPEPHWLPEVAYA